MTVDFLGGRLTSDGGLPWVAAADRALAPTEQLAAALPDRRQRRRHPSSLLLAQRIFQIARGDVDQNDATTLRTDPVRKQVCGRLPSGGKALASQPTFPGWRMGWGRVIATGWPPR